MAPHPVDVPRERHPLLPVAIVTVLDVGLGEEYAEALEHVGGDAADGSLLVRTLSDRGTITEAHPRP